MSLIHQQEETTKTVTKETPKVFKILRKNLPMSIPSSSTDEPLIPFGTGSQEAAILFNPETMTAPTPTPIEKQVETESSEDGPNDKDSSNPDSVKSKLKDKNAHLRENFMLVCDSLGEQDVHSVNIGGTGDGFWSSLGKSLLSSKSKGDRLIVGTGTEVHLFELRDDIKEMCHTKPLVDYRVQALHSCQLEDLYKRVMKNKVYRCPSLAQQNTDEGAAPNNPLMLKNRSKQHGRI